MDRKRFTEFKENLRVFFTIDDGDIVDGIELKESWHRFYTFVQIVLRTFNGFAKNRQGFQAVALSYFGLMAFVPLVAIVFAITDGVGLANEDQLAQMLHSIAFLADKPEMTEWIVGFALTIVEQAQSGGVGLVSSLLFTWTVIWLFFQIERVFNYVWKTENRRDRNLAVRFGWFLGMLILLPFILMSFGSPLVLYANPFKFMNLDFETLNKLVPWMLLVLFGTMTFSLMFKFIPEVRVKYRYALSSALVTSIVFCLFQYMYLETQMFMSRLNGVYGVMAAIPLFLIWMNFSWQIILYGANLTKAVQDTRLGEEYAFSKKYKNNK